MPARASLEGSEGTKAGSGGRVTGQSAAASVEARATATTTKRLNIAPLRLDQHHETQRITPVLPGNFPAAGRRKVNPGKHRASSVKAAVGRSLASKGRGIAIKPSPGDDQRRLWLRSPVKSVTPHPNLLAGHMPDPAGLKQCPKHIAAVKEVEAWPGLTGRRRRNKSGLRRPGNRAIRGQKR